MLRLNSAFKTFARELRFIARRRWRKRQLKTTFCINFFSQASTKTNGLFRPCCHFVGVIKDENEKPFHAATHSIKDYFFSNALKEIRRKALNKEPIAGCENCYEIEKATQQSKRIRDNDRYHEIWKEIRKKPERAEIKMLDLRLGNDCNLGCVSCIPALSSKLEQLWGKHGAIHFTDDPMLTKPVKSKEVSIPWYNQINLVEQINELQNDLSYLAYVGGEPLINDTNFDILESLEGKGKKLNLHVTSNLMALTDEKLRTLEKFNTQINCSLDGVNETIEYIRFPAKFWVIEKNLRKILNSSVNVQIIFTVSVLNLFHIVEAYRVYRKIHDDCGRGLNLTVGNFVIKPGHLAVKNLPKELKQQALTQLEPLYHEIKRDETQAVFSASLLSLIKYLHNTEGDVDIIKSGWRFVKKYDEIRGNNWKECAPWMGEVLNEL